jgi:hypothetical protein
MAIVTSRRKRRVKAVQAATIRVPRICAAHAQRTCVEVAGARSGGTGTRSRVLREDGHQAADRRGRIVTDAIKSLLMTIGGDVAGTRHQPIHTGRRQLLIPHWVKRGQPDVRPGRKPQTECSDEEAKMMPPRCWLLLRQRSPWCALSLRWPSQSLLH